MLRNGKHKNSKLQTVWDLFSEEDFSFEVVEECGILELDELETRYLQNEPEETLLNISRSFYGGNCGPSLNRKIAAKKLWEDPDYRKEFRNRKDEQGRFVSDTSGLSFE